MSEYRGIFGEAIQSLPSSTGTIEGQIWYDSSSTNFKLIGKTGTAAFSTGTALPIKHITKACKASITSKGL